MTKVVKETLDEIRKKWNESNEKTDIQKIKEITGYSVKEIKEIKQLWGIDHELNK